MTWEAASFAHTSEFVKHRALGVLFFFISVVLFLQGWRLLSIVVPTTVLVIWLLPIIVCLAVAAFHLLLLPEKKIERQNLEVDYKGAFEIGITLFALGFVVKFRHFSSEVSLAPNSITVLGCCYLFLSYLQGYKTLFCLALVCVGSTALFFFSDGRASLMFLGFSLFAIAMCKGARARQIGLICFFLLAAFVVKSWFKYRSLGVLEYDILSVIFDLFVRRFDQSEIWMGSLQYIEVAGSIGSYGFLAGVTNGTFGGELLWGNDLGRSLGVLGESDFATGIGMGLVGEAILRFGIDGAAIFVVFALLFLYGVIRFLARYVLFMPAVCHWFSILLHRLEDQIFSAYYDLLVFLILVLLIGYLRFLFFEFSSVKV